MLSGVISIGVVSTSHFFRRAVRRGISHLCWSSDEIDPLVVVSLYFTLYLYFGNIVNVPFSKQSTRCWGSIDWSYTISLGLFPKRMSIEYAIAKTPQSVVSTCLWHGDSWYCGNMLPGRKAISFVAESQKLDQCLSCRKFWHLRRMMITVSNGEHCCELFELFHKESTQSQMQSRET